MKTATIQEIKQELQALAPGKLVELCLRLGRFKKENKELLTYLLFEAHDEEAYINSVKMVIDEGFAELPKPNAYLTKKSLRKTLRITSKYIRYTGSRVVEASLLIYFCQSMREIGLSSSKNTVLLNIYQMQLKKIRAAVETLHEDLQYDFKKELNLLEV